MPPKKEIKTTIKMILAGGQATPAPPVGPTLGQYGVQPGDFCKRFNDMTKSKPGVKLRCTISLYTDRTYSIEVKSPLTSFLIKQAAGIVKGSSNPKLQKVGKISHKQLEEIARQKMVDLNTNDLDAAKKVVAGTARNMGILIE